MTSGSDVVEVSFPSCHPILSIRPARFSATEEKTKIVVARSTGYTRATMTHSISRSLPGHGKKGGTRDVRDAAKLDDDNYDYDDVATFHPFFRATRVLVLLRSLALYRGNASPAK